jgi:hypothetical protein
MVTRTHLHPALLALALLTCVGCGTGGEESPAPAQALTWSGLPDDLTPLPPLQGPAYKLLGPEDVGLDDGVEYWVKAGGSFVAHDGRQVPHVEETIDPGFDYLGDLYLAKTPAGTAFMIVAGAQGTTPLAKAKIYFDSNANGRIESGEVFLTLSDDSPHATEGSAWSWVHPISSGWLLLDLVTRRIRLIVDSDADGVPDQLAPTPWLDTTQTHLLDEVLSLADGPDDSVTLLAGIRHGAVPAGGQVVCVSDSDSDGRADQTATDTLPLWPPANPPSILDRPDSDDASVLVAGPVGTIEVVTVDTQDNVTAIIGTGQIAAGTDEATVTIPVQPLGARLAARLATQPIGGVVVVQGPAPFIYETTPSPIDSNQATTLAVTGKGFTAGTSFTLTSSTSSREPITPTVTYISSVRVDLSIPAVPGEWGTWTLQAWEAGQLAHAVTVTFHPE